MTEMYATRIVCIYTDSATRNKATGKQNKKNASLSKNDLPRSNVVLSAPII